MRLIERIEKLELSKIPMKPIKITVASQEQTMRGLVKDKNGLLPIGVTDASNEAN